MGGNHYYSKNKRNKVIEEGNLLLVLAKKRAAISMTPTEAVVLRKPFFPPLPSFKKLPPGQKWLQTAREQAKKNSLGSVIFVDTESIHKTIVLWNYVKFVGNMDMTHVSVILNALHRKRINWTKKNTAPHRLLASPLSPPCFTLSSLLPYRTFHYTSPPLYFDNFGTLAVLHKTYNKSSIQGAGVSL